MCDSIVPGSLREDRSRYQYPGPCQSNSLAGRAILIEVRRVMTYPRLQARWPLLTEAIEQYTSFLRDSAAMADLPESFPSVISDPDDDLVLQTAIAGKAEVLCSRDVDFEPESVRQVCATHGIRIMATSRSFRSSGG